MKKKRDRHLLLKGFYGSYEMEMALERYTQEHQIAYAEGRRKIWDKN